jgi:hypothetical protein
MRAPGKTRRRKVVLIVLAALLVYPSVTYVNALTYPGEAPFTVRTVDWMRQVGLGGVVNAVENWWFTRHQPSTAPPDASALPAPQVMPAESTFVVQPDPAHASVVAGVAKINQQLTRTMLIAGTKEPGGISRPEGSKVPSGSPLATFNAGFLFKDIKGGYYAHGQYARPLRDGDASVVIDQNGVVSVAQWGRDVTMSPNIQAVRQNLSLVVDGGQPVQGLMDNLGGRWGNPRNQFQYTWRSGLGTDQVGNLIYVGGNNLTLATLANAMVQAGIVRGMELDIHSAMVTFNSYQPGSSPAKLLPTMSSPADRYQKPDQRDFFAVVLKDQATAKSWTRLDDS